RAPAAEKRLDALKGTSDLALFTAVRVREAQARRTPPDDASSQAEDLVTRSGENTQAWAELGRAWLHGQARGPEGLLGTLHRRIDRSPNNYLLNRAAASLY